VLKAARLIAIVVIALLFWCAWYVVPDLLATDKLRWLSGVVTVLWALEFYVLQRLSAVSAVEGLTSKEHERLVLRLASIRRRVWLISVMCLVCAVTTWLLAELRLPMSSPLYAAMMGLLLGISVSYLILVPGWVNESQAFIDEARRQDVLVKRRQETVKSFGEPEKRARNPQQLKPFI